MTRTRCSAPRVSIEQLLRAVGGWRGSSGGGGRNRTGVDGFAVWVITEVGRTTPNDIASLRYG
jgi:hypothetical protein